MKLIGGNKSPFVRRIAMVLDMLGCDYQQQEVRTDEDGELIRRYNPVGRVPILVLEDERVIIDSHAILDYLERREGGTSTLFPQEEDQRMTMLFADSLAVAALEKLVLWFYEHTRRDPTLRCVRTVAAHEEQIRTSLSWLSTSCTPEGHLCGDELTLADITTTSLVNTLAVVAPALLEGPEMDAVKALASRVSARFSSAA